MDFLDINWNTLELDKEDPTHSLNIFFKHINKLLDKHIPLKK